MELKKLWDDDKQTNCKQVLNQHRRKVTSEKHSAPWPVVLGWWHVSCLWRKSVAGSAGCRETESASSPSNRHRWGLILSLHILTCWNENMVKTFYQFSYKPPSINELITITESDCDAQKCWCLKYDRDVKQHKLVWVEDVKKSKVESPTCSSGCEEDMRMWSGRH